MELATCPEAIEHVAIELPLEPESAARARAAVSTLSAYTDASSFEDVRLLTSELVADTVATGQASPQAVITLEAEVLDGTTSVMLAFDGLAVQIPADRPAPAEPGWGVYLTRTLANRWGVQRTNGSTYVWFEA